MNDAYGHPAGDDYLRRAANILGEQLRETDIVARVGGDEFGVIVPNTDSVAADELVERLSIALEQAGIAASIGHAQYSMTEGFVGAWNCADSAMYERKRTRRPMAPVSD